MQERGQQAAHTFKFPSPEAAWGFAQQAREMGHEVALQGRVNLFAPGTHAAVWLGAVVGGVLLALVGVAAENFSLGLPRLGPLFAAPTGAPTLLLAMLGGSAGALVGGLVTLRAAPAVVAAREERAAAAPNWEHHAYPPERGQVIVAEPGPGAPEGSHVPPMPPVLVEARGEREMLAHTALEWGGQAVPSAAEQHQADGPRGERA